jgi:hypothetical protein
MKLLVPILLLFACPVLAQSATQPAIVSAREWGSKPQPIPETRKHTPRWITIHHAGELWTAKRTPEEYLRGMQIWGQNQKHWPDLPYHFLIAPDGRIFAGRPIEYEPDTNTNYSLAGNIGVEMFGNFQEQRPSRQQLQSLVKLTAWLAQQYQIDMAHIRTHKDAAPGQTDCPGKDFYRYIVDGQFKAWVAATMKGENPDIQPGPALPDGPTEPIPTTRPATQPSS